MELAGMIIGILGFGVGFIGMVLASKAGSKTDKMTEILILIKQLEWHFQMKSPDKDIQKTTIKLMKAVSDAQKNGVDTEGFIIPNPTNIRM